MFKKYLIATVICVAGVVGGIQTHSVDASASYGDSQQSEQKSPTYDKVDRHNTDRYSDFDRLYKYYHKRWNKRWNNQWNKQWDDPVVENPWVNAPVTPEKPKPSEPEKPVVNQPAPQQPQPKPEVEKPAESKPDYQAGALNQFEQQVVELTNQERIKNGLPALKVDYELSKVAREKSRDIQKNGYFDHNSPVYGSPFDMMDAFGIKFRSAGENIAKGQRTPAEVVNAWMNSPGHRANILSGSYTHIGVGYVEQGNVWTQHFIGN